MRNPKTCNQAGCDGRVYTNERCRDHLPVCSVATCERPAIGVGLCSTHYGQYRRVAVTLAHTAKFAARLVQIDRDVPLVTVRSDVLDACRVLAAHAIESDCPNHQEADHGH